MESIYWWLASAPGWGAVKCKQLSLCLGDGPILWDRITQSKDQEDLYHKIHLAWNMTTEGQTGQILRIERKDVGRLLEHMGQWDRCQKEYRQWRDQGIRCIPLVSQEYPQRLRQLYDPPFVLFVRGNLPQENRKTAAIIGARACTGYGLGQARRMGRELAQQGVQIISGLAYGIDGEGHRGALESQETGATYAVLGSGVDRIYPAEHEAMAKQILRQGGGILSEYPPGTDPHPSHFPMRNRIISGLSDCILVMEARKRSGSLITVDQALEQGREVFALPGRIGDPLSEGCLHLIKHGANLLLDSSEVLEFLGAIPCAQRMHPTETQSEKNLVYSCLDPVGKTVEEIMADTGLSLEMVRGELLSLLLEDQIQERVPGYYARIS